jgi:hypothetical protein
MDQAIPQTDSEIETEWQYRYNEALALGRNEARARKEADEWKSQFYDKRTENTIHNRNPPNHERKT